LEKRIAQRTDALRISQQCYRTLMMMAADGISVVDETGRIVACNERFARIHGSTTDPTLRAHR
jgi:PAS domain S-box-containing protein